MQCAFMTVITLTTIGYGDWLHIEGEGNAGAQIYTMILGIGGMGIVLYGLSSITAVLVRGEVRRIRKKARLLNMISELSKHIIVCGVGTTGQHVVNELDRSGAKFVLVDADQEYEKQWPGRPFIAEDATQEETLEKAGDEEFKYDPGPEDRLDPGDVILVIGSPDQYTSPSQMAGSSSGRSGRIP
ncbi:MAG: NAD-binding protein [Planctomycetota bacterium]|nr:NAD-binding protein [Planctomycetota bacterium]